MRFTSSVRLHTSSESRSARSSSPKSWTAAFATTMSSPPNVATASPTLASTDGSDATSVQIAWAARPCSRSPHAAPSTASASMSSSATRAPSRARRSAVARPIPEPAPVTIARFPATRPLAVVIRPPFVRRAAHGPQHVVDQTRRSVQLIGIPYYKRRLQRRAEETFARPPRMPTIPHAFCACLP